MKRLELIIVASLLCSYFGASADAFDEIVRKSGKSSKGNITELTRDSVTITTGVGDKTTVPANEIINVSWDSEPAELNLARSAEQTGNLPRALEGYQTSAGKAGSNEDIKAEIDFLIARTTARTALEQDSSKLEDAAKKLDAFSKANASSYRHFDTLFLLGQVQLAREEFDAAGQAFTKLAQAPWSDYKMAAQNANARLAMKKGDLGVALSSYEKVLTQNAKTPAEVSRRNEALLGKADVMLQQNNAQLALETINSAIGTADPEDTAVQAAAFVLKGDSLKALGRTKEAILAYLHVPVLFEKEAVLHARALYNLATLWPKVDQPERGAAARTELQDNYPDSPWTKMLGQ